MTTYVFATSPSREMLTLRRLEESPLGILYEGPNATLLVVTLQQPTDSILATESGLHVPTSAEIAATAIDAEDPQVVTSDLTVTVILEQLRPLTARLGITTITWSTNPDMGFEDDRIIRIARDVLQASLYPTSSTGDRMSGPYL